MRSWGTSSTATRPAWSKGLNVAQSHHPTLEGPTLNVAITLRRFGFNPVLLTPSGRDIQCGSFVSLLKDWSRESVDIYREEG